MQNIFDFNQQANQSLLGGQRAERAIGIPVQRALPGSFAPGASNDQADAVLSQIEADTLAMAGNLPKQSRPPVVGYNPGTKEVFSGGKTFKLDLDQAPANAHLLDLDNQDLPDGFVPIYGDEVKAKLTREYGDLGFVDALQRRAGQAVSNVGSTMQDLGAESVGQTMQDYGGALARRNPSKIAGAADLLAQPGQATVEALGEISYDVPMAVAQTAVGAKIGASLGTLAAPFTGGASVPLGAFLGGAAGRFIGTLAETYGSVRSEQREAGREDRGRALAAASGSAALEALLGPEAMAGNLVGRAVAGQTTKLTLREAAKQATGGHIARQAALGALTEGPLTEVPQSALERWGAYKDLTGQEAYDEYAVGAFKGAVGGAAASPLSSMPEFVQARNFIANLQEDMRIAADPAVPSAERVAAARRAQDVLRGSSDDPQFDAQLKAFREKVAAVDAEIARQEAATAASEAVATGAPVNLMELPTPLDRDRSAEQDARLAARAEEEAEGPVPELGAILAADHAGQQWQELQAKRAATLMQAAELAPQVQQVLDARRQQLVQSGDAAAQVGEAAQPLVNAMEQSAPPAPTIDAVAQAGQQFQDVMSGNLLTAVEDPETYGPYLDWQNAAMGGEPGVASLVNPSMPVGPRSAWAPSQGQPVAATLPTPTAAPVEPLSARPAPVVSSSDPGVTPAAPKDAAGPSLPAEPDGDVEAELDKILKAQAQSQAGTVGGRVTLPQGVMAGIIRAVRSGRPPVVYEKGTANVDLDTTEEWGDRMRELADGITNVAQIADRLFNRESNVVPSTADKAGKKQGDRALTGKDVEATTVAASEAAADVGALRAQLRNAIDNLRGIAGDMDIEAMTAVLKTRVQQVRSKDAAKAKADTKLDTTFSRAWAMFKDGALDNIEQLDVVRGRPMRESFEQKRKGATQPPLFTAAEEGETRRPQRQRRGESDKAFKARVEAAKEKGVPGMLAYIQRHGTAFERLLAASVSRAMRRFAGTSDAPKYAWVAAEVKPYYDPKTNTVFVHQEASPEEILHETLHAALQWYVYQNPDTAEVRMLDKALQKVLDADVSKWPPVAAEVVKVLRTVAKGRSKTARIDAILELVSYGSTLSEFRNALKTMETVQDADGGAWGMSGLTAIWQRLTALIQRFLGVSNSVANDVLDGTIALLEQAADPGIDAPGKRKGNILKAEVMTGMDIPEAEVLRRPGATLPTDADVRRYNKKVLPSFLSTKALFDLVGWDKVAVGATKQSAKLADTIRKNHPSLTRWISYVNSRFSVPQDVRGAFEQYKDDKQAGYKLTERLATFVQFQPPAKVQAIFDYLDGNKQALGDDKAMMELADEVKRWRDFYVKQLGNDKASRFFASGKFSETMLFANDSDNVASQTFGQRRLNQMLGEKKKVEENLNEGWMMLDARGDAVLEGKFYEVFHRDADGNRVSDGFMAADVFDRDGPPAGLYVDTEFVWFHTSFANGKHTFRASMTVKQAVAARKSEQLANALRNTMAALANNYASKQFSEALVAYGHADGVAANAVVFDDIKAAEAAFGVKIRPDTVLKAGSDEARSMRAQHLYRSPYLWVQLPKSEAYGALAGKLVRSGVWSAMQDMSDRRPVVNMPGLNTSMRWFKKAKTVYNPGTHLTNIATNFTLASLHDIPLATVKEAARLFQQYETRPNSMKASERQLVLAFINSNAMVGDFSSAEVKQALYDAMRQNLEGDATITGRLAALAKMEKAKAEMLQRMVDKGKRGADRIDELVTGVYAAEDNVFRLAAYLKHAADLAAQRDDGRPTAEDLQAAGDFARWAFLDYDIDSKAVRIARQTVLPFISWTYAIIPVLGKIAVHQPWKIANVMLAYAILEHAFQEAAGGDEEDERLRKTGPEYIRDRMFGFGPYTHIRLPFLGDDKNPVYYRLGDYLPWTSVARGQHNGFMGQEWFPSAITPTGPLVSTTIIALTGRDPYFGKELAPPTATQWEKLLASSREVAGLVLPPPAVDALRWDRIEDIAKGRTDKAEGFAAAQIARWAGLKLYEFNEEKAGIAQARAVKAIMAEYKQEIGRLRRAEARFERPDWEGFARKQQELLERMQDEINNARGE